MKASLALLVIFGAVLVSLAEAGPVQQQSAFVDADFEPAVADHGDRHRRVTCDLLSFTTQWGSFGHSACAAHCLAMFRGYRGGHCDSNGICVCRK